MLNYFIFTLLQHIWDVSLCVCRSVWNIHSTWCSTATSRMQSISCLLLRVGGMGRSQQLSIRTLNWSRPTGVYWITSSGVTKSSHTPKLVIWDTSWQPKHLLFIYIHYQDMLQAPVWSHTATLWSDKATTHIKKKVLRDFWLNAHWCDGIFLSQTQSKLVLLFSDHHDTGDNQDMHSYFRQASVNLKEILKNPGVWDPFILSYVEVSTQSQLLDLIKEAYTSNITQWNRIDSSCSNQSTERKSAAILIIDLYFLHFIATSSWNAIHLAVQQIKCSVRLVLVEFQAKFKWNVPALLIV